MQGPEKIEEVILKRWFSGAKTTPEFNAQAAFHAAMNAGVSSLEPSPMAPKDVTSKTEPEEEEAGGFLGEVIIGDFEEEEGGE